MKVNNPFDQKLRDWGKDVPNDIREASTYVTDTLELCWVSAQSIFEDNATPEIAFEIYDRIMHRISNT
jgi:hypothetical protein